MSEWASEWASEPCRPQVDRRDNSPHGMTLYLILCCSSSVRTFRILPLKSVYFMNMVIKLCERDGVSVKMCVV